MEAAIAGDFGVPLWLVTGDSAGMAEARDIIPGVRTVTVKEAMDEFAAQCYPPILTAQKLRQAAEELLTDPPSVAPLVFDGPIKLEIELADDDYLAKLHFLHPEMLDDENVVLLEEATVTRAWSWHLELQAEIHAALRETGEE